MPLLTIKCCLEWGNKLIILRWLVASEPYCVVVLMFLPILLIWHVSTSNNSKLKDLKKRLFQPKVMQIDHVAPATLVIHRLQGAPNRLLCPASQLDICVRLLEQADGKPHPSASLQVPLNSTRWTKPTRNFLAYTEMVPSSANCTHWPLVSFCPPRLLLAHFTSALQCNHPFFSCHPPIPTLIRLLQP